LIKSARTSKGRKRVKGKEKKGREKANEVKRNKARKKRRERERKGFVVSANSIFFAPWTELPELCSVHQQTYPEYFPRTIDHGIETESSAILRQ